MELLAIPLGRQKTTAKWLVMFGHPHGAPCPYWLVMQRRAPTGIC